MITQPSIPRLLESMRDELTEKILPVVDDPVLKVNIEMMTAVLNALAVRTENEIAWMLEESNAIESAANDLSGSMPDSSSLDAALDDLRSNRPESMRLSDVAASYGKASEVLSCLADAAYRSGHAEAIATVEELVDSRLATEQTAIGEFIAVGRE
ncbi:MAG: hypothetical protein ACR2PK_06810 [Acidimicrobiales bacterium]